MKLVIKYPAATDPKHAAEAVVHSIEQLQSIMVGDIGTGTRFDLEFATRDNRLEAGWWKLEP